MLDIYKYGFKLIYSWDDVLENTFLQDKIFDTESDAILACTIDEICGYVIVLE